PVHASVLCRPASLAFLFASASPVPTYPLSLHDALPISFRSGRLASLRVGAGGQRQRSDCERGHEPDDARDAPKRIVASRASSGRSEEHTSELQSRVDLVCRLLLEKKKKSGTWRMRRSCS